jgi:hypothetical protein
LSSWLAWEGEACRRSGSAAILGGVFALALVFVISLSLFGRTPGDNSIPIVFIGVIVYFGTSFALMALAVLRVNAWKRANPWTPPS